MPAETPVPPCRESTAEWPRFFHGPAFAARLATLALHGGASPGFDKQCEFQPGVVFSVSGAEGKLDLLLCLTCDVPA